MGALRLRGLLYDLFSYCLKLKKKMKEALLSASWHYIVNHAA